MNMSPVVAVSENSVSFSGISDGFSYFSGSCGVTFALLNEGDTKCSETDRHHGKEVARLLGEGE
jgi:hypothetical protein